MGTDTSTEKKENDNKTSTTKQTFKTFKKIGRIKFDDIVGVPMQIESAIIFISQDRMTHIQYKENDNNDDNDDNKENKLYRKTPPANSKYLKLNKYNLKTQQLSDPINIETEEYKIDIENCVYCIDKENNNLIYLINKNEEIFTISTEKNEAMIKSLTYIDPGNKVTDKPKDSKNIATLTMHNNKLIVLGAIRKYNDNNNNKTNSNIQYIPYDLIKNKNGKDQLAICKFGKLTSVEYIAENNCIILMGGATRYGTTDVFIPTNIIWQCLLSNDMDYKWGETPLYLPDAMHSFGIIHLDLDRIRYIILFGGTHVHITKEKEEQTNLIYVLYLNKKYQKLTEEEIKKLEENDKYKKKNKKKNKQKKNELYHGFWFELNYQLPIKANYYAFYDGNIDKDTIHLITYNDGIHLTLSYKELMNVLETDKLLTEDGKDGTCHKCHPWTEAGKTVIPTKIAKLKSRGLKKGKKVIINTTKKDVQKKEIISSKKSSIDKNKNKKNGNDNNEDIGKGTDNVIPIKFKIKGGGPKDISSTKETIS